MINDIIHTCACVQVFIYMFQINLNGFQLKIKYTWILLFEDNGTLKLKLQWIYVTFHKAVIIAQYWSNFADELLNILHLWINLWFQLWFFIPPRYYFRIENIFFIKLNVYVFPYFQTIYMSIVLYGPSLALNAGITRKQ